MLEEPPTFLVIDLASVSASDDAMNTCDQREWPFISQGPGAAQMDEDPLAAKVVATARPRSAQYAALRTLGSVVDWLKP